MRDYRERYGYTAMRSSLNHLDHTPASSRATLGSFGYKVCYKEEGKTNYVRHFLTYTYKQAVYAKCCYIRYPPTARNDGHKLKNPKWKIISVRRVEVSAGIWRECPF